MQIDDSGDDDDGGVDDPDEDQNLEIHRGMFWFLRWFYGCSGRRGSSSVHGHGH